MLDGIIGAGWTFFSAQMELLELDSDIGVHLSVFKQMSSGLFTDNATYKLFSYK